MGTSVIVRSAVSSTFHVLVTEKVFPLWPFPLFCCRPLLRWGWKCISCSNVGNIHRVERNTALLCLLFFLGGLITWLNSIFIVKSLLLSMMVKRLHRTEIKAPLNTAKKSNVALGPLPPSFVRPYRNQRGRKERNKEGERKKDESRGYTHRLVWSHIGSGTC